MRISKQSTDSAALVIKKSLSSIYSDPVRFFVFHAAIFGILAIILVPPFSNADEPVQFEHAYAISKGQLIAHRQGTAYGSYLPLSIVPALNKPSYLIGNSEQKYSFSITKSLLGDRLKPGVQTFYDYRYSAPYSPLAYIPQSVAILLGRLFQFSPVMLMYLARLAGLVVFIAAGAYALSIMPIRKWLSSLLLSLPMVLYIASTVSADTMTMSALVVVVGLVFAAKQKPTFLRRKGPLVLLIVAALTLATSKQAYLPLALLPGLLLFDKRFWQSRWQRLSLVVIVASTIMVWFGWFVITQNLNLPPPGRVGAVTSHQALHNIKHNPSQYSAILANTVTSNRGDYLVTSLVGNFGWEDTPLPTWMIVIIYAILMMYILKDEKVPKLFDRRERILVILLALATTLLVMTAVYLYWTLPSEVYIDGLQGKYFWPIIFVLAQVVATGLVAFKTRAFVIVYSVMIGISLVIVAYRYYPLPSPFIQHTNPSGHLYVQSTRY
jgi:uncharacterized membrane protein